MSRQTALRALLRLPLPARPVPRVIGVDDFALRKRTATPDPGRRRDVAADFDVLSDRKTDALQAWLRAH